MTVIWRKRPWFCHTGSCSKAAFAQGHGNETDQDMYPTIVERIATTNCEASTTTRTDALLKECAASIRYRAATTHSVPTTTKTGTVPPEISKAVIHRNGYQIKRVEETMNTTVATYSTCGRRAPRQKNVDPSIRVGDPERERAASKLGQAFTLGYLSMEEYETRLEQALQARTAGALHHLLIDLPVDRINRHDPRRRAARKAVARRAVHVHLALYMVMAILTVGIWLAIAITVGAWYFWPIWPILGGGIGVISHALPVKLRTRSRH